MCFWKFHLNGKRFIVNKNLDARNAPQPQRRKSREESDAQFDFLTTLTILSTFFLVTKQRLPQKYC